MRFTERLMHGWNAFMNKDPTGGYYDYGQAYARNPSRSRFTRGNERSIITAVYNRIALDAAAIDISHCKMDEGNRYVEDVKSGLNECLKISANTDQTGRAFIQDVVMSMLDDGVVAVVPVETNINPINSGSWDVTQLRTARIIDWYPQHIKVQLYDERDSQKKEVVLPKSMVAIIENPFYAVMNEPSSTMQRLARKLSLSDIMDEQTGSGKLDVIVQLPYTIKTEARRAQAEARRKDLETQLATSKFGIAYADSAEHITQLNRSLDNHILDSIEYLTNMLYSQLGLTTEIMNGTASDSVMNNYYSRTIEPILAAICDEFKRKFLTKTARSQHQSIEFFRDPFALLPVSSFAELADKLTRNEIMTSNELRQKIGMKPADDPAADELRNKNLSESKGEQHVNIDGEDITDEYNNE